MRPLPVVVPMGLYGILLLLHPSASLATGHERKVSASPATTMKAPACDPNVTSSTSCPVEISTFGTSLFAALSERSGGAGGNLLVSPLSVARGLSLLSAGATPSSRCQAELLAALGADSHEAVPLLTESLLSSAAAAGSSGDDGGGGDVSLTTASSVWLDGSVDPAFADVAASVHSATVHGLPPTYGPMNGWVANSTHGLIPDLFADPSRSLDPLVRAYLLDVVYFKGSWTEKFDVAKTEVGTFHRGDGTTVSPVRFMKDRRHVGVGRIEKMGGATVVELSYGESRQDERGFDLPSDFAALFVLPSDASSEAMEAAVRGMTDQSLTEIMDELHPREVKLSLPKFKLEWGTASLKEALRALGINDVFDGNNVLSAMSDDPDLHLDDVLHKAVMEVSEEGTVATAATAMKIQTRSMPPPPLEVAFDRPFVVAIVHVPTGTPIFLGRVENPALSFASDQ